MEANPAKAILGNPTRARETLIRVVPVNKTAKAEVEMRANRHALAGVVTAAFVFCAGSNVLYAQQTPPPDRPDRPPAATTADDRDEMDWGWLGLLGLIGLAGLMGNRRDVAVRTTTTRGNP